MKAVSLAWGRSLALLLLAGLPAIATAQVIRCTDANGAVSFQDHPCAPGQTQQLIDVPSRSPPGYVPPAPMSTSPPIASTPPLPDPEPVLPPPPLPVMYACTGYVNGKRYLTRTLPGPYLAPLGVMGYPPQMLSQAYGAPGGAGMSAPELAPKPRVGGPSIAAGMTEVWDECIPAPHAEVCGYVRSEYGENHRKLRMAMPHEQAHYEEREQQLAAQLQNC